MGTGTGDGGVRGGTVSEEQEYTPLHEHLKEVIEILYDKCCKTDKASKQKNDGGSKQHDHDRRSRSTSTSQGHTPLHIERTSTIGMYGLYCLYRRLLPSHIPPDESFHYSLCTNLPSINP